MLLSAPSAPPGPPAALGPYLRILWGIGAPIVPTAATDGGSPAPFLSDLGIHLPSAPPADDAHGGTWHLAAAAHAAAHLVHTRLRLPWASRRPITRALIGALEDARVETLALRELPGLRRLWLVRHTATPALGDGFAPLLARLGRALIDPAYDDPHPWVAKGRRLFHATDGVLAVPSTLPLIASLLGNDIGQLRLPFNDRGYRVVPDYRDDNRWLWEPEATEDLAVGGPSPADDPGRQLITVPPPLTLHPEWDRLLRRLRPAWCTVRDLHPPPAGVPANAPDARLVARLARVLRQPQAMTRPAAADDGDDLDVRGLVETRVAQRLRRPGDGRVHLRRHPVRQPLLLLVLLDVSASTAETFRGSGRSVLAAAQTGAEAIAAACAATGTACGVHAFCSTGRHDIGYQRISDPGEPWDAAARRRLHALRSGCSTRLGTAVRHAATLLRERPESRRVILVMTDGEPHDVDVHDPRYLVEDARQAAEAARRCGIRVGALGLATGCAAGLQRMLGAGCWALLSSLESLPQAVGQVLAGTA